MEVPEKPHKRRLSAEQRQEEIVRVAIDLAAQRGVETVTTQDMAEAMGLTQGAIFRHFPTKDAIWLAAIQWIRSRLMRTLETAAAGSTNPLEALEAMFLAHISFVAKHPSIPRIVFSDHLLYRDTRLKQLIQEIITGYEARIADLLSQAKAAGLARPDLDEASAATLYIGMIQGLVLQSNIFAGKRALLEQARKVLPIYLNGVRAQTD